MLKPGVCKQCGQPATEDNPLVGWRLNTEPRDASTLFHPGCENVWNEAHRRIRDPETGQMIINPDAPRYVPDASEVESYRANLRRLAREAAGG